MALTTRRPMYITAAGFAEEMASNDYLELGRLTMSGFIDMVSNKVKGLAQADTPGDALGWGQNASIVNLTVTGAVQQDLDMGTHKITNVVDPVNAQDAATKFYVDAVATGLDVKKSVRAIAISNITLSGLQTIDGVSLVAGDRVLVAGQTAGADNGIYVVASGAWSRASDADSSAELNAGAFTFIEEGTLYHDCGFVMTADEPFTLGTTAQVWTQFSRAGVLQPRNGLSLNGLFIDVDTGDGIYLDGSDAVAINLATDPGLQFTSNKLDLKLASADQLSKDSSGLKVEGVPSLFKIAGTATSANVTSANLGTLTAGTESSAESLHIHGLLEHAFSASSVAAGDPVYQSGNDTVGKADAADDAKRWVNGIVRSAAGGTAQVVSFGLAKGVLSGATAGARYWLQASGGIGTSQPASGNNLIQVGVAANATDLFVHIIDQGKRV